MFVGDGKCQGNFLNWKVEGISLSKWGFDWLHAVNGLKRCGVSTIQ